MYKTVLFGVAVAALLAPSEASACMLPEVNFNAGSIWVSARGQEEVASIIEAARSEPDAKVKLIATTDYSVQNRRMAGRRVSVVRAALVKGGVREGRIFVEYVHSRGERARVVAMEVISAPTC